MFNRNLIKAILNHPGSRSVNTILKLNRTTVSKFEETCNMYIDACVKDIEYASDDEEKASTEEKLSDFKCALRKAYEAK